ncbi:M57 family metalloprotease [Flaviaesturariibacter amylovorans]|uniref:Protease n=1 Tax=Flaviaesturariibacter amylovorans TaxID=1084520 RepID=A0ABP8HIU6_9BACT
MNRLAQPALIAGLTLLTLASCKKDAKETTPVDGVSTEVLAQIKAAGFSTQDVKKVDEGYLVEGDIILTPDQLAGMPTTNNLIYANEEHYRTTNLVNSTSYPTIRVALNNSSSAHQAAFSAALDEAIRRYNALPLRIKFQRVTSSANTTVVAYREVSNTLGSAGFPTNSGAPYSQVRMNTYHYSTGTGTTNVNYIATIMAHELGHCIGFRHTDYMNRAYSCGGAYSNEGASTVGAIHISGTPTGASANSWMLACVGSGVNRPFTSADQTALNYVY